MSSDNRSNNGQTKPELPPDIWLEIFDYFGPTEEISPADSKLAMLKLSLVCRSFRSICLPRAASSLVFSGNHFQHRRSPRLSLKLRSEGKTAAVTFCSAMGEGDQHALAVARYVQKCVIRDWPAPKDGSGWTSVEPLAIANALAKMPNLRSLELKDMSISGALLKSIAKLTSIQSLSIIECSPQSDVRPEDIHALRSLKLSSLETFNSAFSKLDDVIDPQSQTLKIYRTNVYSGPSEWRIDFKLSHALTIPLTVLKLNRLVLEEPQSLFDFLEATPSITHLTLASGMTVIHTSPQPLPSLHLSATSLPHLQHLQCPLEIAPYFGGRPLTSMSLKGRLSVLSENPHVSGNARPIQQPSLFTRSLDETKPPFPCASMLKLEIDPSKFDPDSIVEYYPMLEVLCLHDIYSEPESRLTKMVSSPNEQFRTDLENSSLGSLKRLPIRELEFRSSTPRLCAFYDFFWDLEFQLSIIESDLTSTFPSLQRIAFSEFVVWEGRSGERPWRAFVPYIFREDAVHHLKHLGRHLTDHNDCFASILLPH